MTNTDNELILEHKDMLIKYLINCLFIEISKIVLFSIIFRILGYFAEYLVSLFFLIILRTNGGGIHLKRYFSCFVLSFSILYLNIFFVMVNIIPNILLQFLLFPCCILTLYFVPITSKNRPPVNNTLKNRCKRNTLIIIFTQFISLSLFPNNVYINIGVWTTITHFLQLLFAVLLERRCKNDEFLS